MEIEFIERAIHLFGGEGWSRMDLAARKRVMNYLVDRFDIPLETKIVTAPPPFTIPDYTKWISPSTEPYRRIDPLKITCEDLPGNRFITPPTMLGDPNIRPNIQLKTDDICKDLEL